MLRMTKDVVGKGVQSYNDQSMGRENQYYIYIMASGKNGTLYVGMTNNIKKRVYEHKNKLIDGFTKKYNVSRLVYFETFGDSYSAIAREKTIKGWLRKKKSELLRGTNADWKDLSEDWYD